MGGFEVCSADCKKPTAKWTKVNVTMNTATTVTLQAGAATAAAVRYAHIDSPSLFTGNQLAVYNAEGLPATPGIYNVNSDVQDMGYDLAVQGLSVGFLDVE